MKIKAIALDLDGTLLSSEKKISDINKTVLKYLENKGVKIFIVTGRTYVSAKPFVTELGIDSYIIAYNGAKVVDYKNDEVVFELPLEEKISKKVIELGKERGFHINLYQDNKWYVENLESLETQHYAKHTGLTPIKKSFDTFEDYNMTKITIQDMNNSKEFNEFCNELKRVFGNNVYTAKSQKFLFEILNKNVNKGLILEKVLKNYDISVEECVAFGDANNDLEMLTVVGYGVAMGNSDLELKSKVKYVTDTNDNNGVAKFLKKYFF
ncbi:Cof-type HAD-IIB family hydrolase [uncultured Fusobacterium sp.]|nr:Cof-type HAD-IIB family hydrolase [uncultured Fusobacterium sp.]